VCILGLISQLVQCSFGKLHPKQKCFDDLCIPFCVGKQAADLSRFKSFSNKNLKSNHDLSNRIFIPQIEAQNVLKSQFKFKLLLGFAHHWITGPNN